MIAKHYPVMKPDISLSPCMRKWMLESQLVPAELKCRSSFSMHSPSPTLKGVGYPFYSGRTERGFQKSCAQAELNPDSSALVVGALTTQPQCLPMKSKIAEKIL